MIRDLNINDLVILEKDNLPTLFNGPFKLIKSVEYQGEFIGSFWVRMTTEVSILLRPESNNFTKARAIKELGNFLYCNIPKELGISEALVTFDEGFDPNYVKFLKKHFNFQDVKAIRVRRNDV